MYNDIKMITDLESKYIPGKVAGEQSGCIDAFFDEKDPTWIEMECVPFTGEDEESKTLINYALNNMELADHIREMLMSWRDEGF